MRMVRDSEIDGVSLVGLHRFWVDCLLSALDRFAGIVSFTIIP